jgi:hypothetical protein
VILLEVTGRLRGRENNLYLKPKHSIFHFV